MNSKKVEIGKDGLTLEIRHLHTGKSTVTLLEKYGRICGSICILAEEIPLLTKALNEIFETLDLEEGIRENWERPEAE